MFKKIITTLLLTVMMMAHAGIGTVTDMTGTLVIQRKKEQLPMKLGTTIETNDKVISKNGKATITFEDKTIVKITESSELLIDEFIYDPKTGAGKLGLKAAMGTVRYISGGIAHNNPNAVNIKTPTAAIAVRGTDFVMSVNEIGSSMIILMPSCETEQSVALKGLTCGSGKIDVQTEAGIVNMNRPFQATLVETSATPPTPPIVVNLSGAPLNNNLQMSPPKTTSGVNVIAAAKAAAEKTGDTKKDDSKKEDDSKDTEKQSVAAKSDAAQDKSKAATATEILVNSDAVANQVEAVTDTINPYVKKLWKDKSETQQVGWLYESLSQNNNNYTNIIMPVGTQIQVIVTQDMITGSYNFSGGKAQGQIVINQNYR